MPDPRVYDQSFSLWYGYQERYADFFDYFSKTQECNRLSETLKLRFLRYYQNKNGKYVYGHNTKWDEQELNLIFISLAIEMAHPVAYNCFYATYIDIYLHNVYPLFQEKGGVYIIKKFLQHDLRMFDDVLKIISLTIDGMIDGSVTFNSANFWVQTVESWIREAEGA